MIESTRISVSSDDTNETTISRRNTTRVLRYLLTYLFRVLNILLIIIILESSLDFARDDSYIHYMILVQQFNIFWSYISGRNSKHARKFNQQSA